MFDFNPWWIIGGLSTLAGAWGAIKKWLLPHRNEAWQHLQWKRRMDQLFKEHEEMLIALIPDNDPRYHGYHQWVQEHVVRECRGAFDSVIHGIEDLRTKRQKLGLTKETQARLEAMINRRKNKAEHIAHQLAALINNLVTEMDRLESQDIDKLTAVVTNAQNNFAKKLGEITGLPAIQEGQSNDAEVIDLELWNRSSAEPPQDQKKDPNSGQGGS